MGVLSSEPPNVAVDDPTVLAAGMVITIEPTIIREDGIFQCERVVAVTEDGCEVLPDAPGELRSLPVR
jgi:Xaa-Pro aminopeptidase